jgi:hypothetical protein
MMPASDGLQAAACSLAERMQTGFRRPETIFSYSFIAKAEPALRLLSADRDSSESQVQNR